MLAVAEQTVVHCCAPGAPRGAAAPGRRHAPVAGRRAAPRADDDALGEAVEAGAGLLLGCVPGTDAPLGRPDEVLAPVRRLWRRLGFAPEVLPRHVVVTPTCGLAGATAGYARSALQTCVRAGAALREEPL